MKYSQYFEVRKRPNDEEFIVLKDDYPSELKEFIRGIHERFDCMPNDWIYQTISQAFDDFDDGYTYDDINLETDPYYSQLYKWLGNPFAAQCCNEALINECEESDSIYGIIARGQYLAKDTIYRLVFDFINEEKEKGQ